MTMFLPLGLGVPTRADYASIAREGYIRNSVVFACIREIAEAAAGVRWLLFRREPGGGRKEVFDHPILQLIDRPNEIQGKFEFIESCISSLFLSRNAFIEAVLAH